MLKELYIKNVAVIDELRLNFDKGFHIFTGETGAGKSILVESIGLVLGEKAKGPLIRDGAPEATVEAIFDVSDFAAVKTLVIEEGLGNADDPDELIIRRQIHTSGKNQVFINHQRSSMALLKNISALLIDYTGQHEQIELLDTRRDIEVLDSFLAAPNLLDEYHTAFESVRELQRTTSDLERTILEKNERLEWLKYQLKELNELKVESPEVETELKARRASLKHAASISQFASLAANALTEGETSCLNNLILILRELEKQEHLSALFGPVTKNLRDAKVSLEDVAFEIAKIVSKCENVNGTLPADEIEGRLFHLEKLKRKFGPEITDVIRKRDELAAEKISLENSDENLAELKKKLHREMIVLADKARALSEARQGVSKKVEKAVLKELSELKMSGTQFQIAVRPAPDPKVWQSYHARGSDAVAFLLSPNPGLALKPLAQIASGGETSRIFLALKQVLTRFRKSGTLIFDEIDTGISGAAVELTGKKLKILADRFQVFCITHHAQIASLADRHFLVLKEISKGKTFTRVKLLSGNEQVQEVARLMGGVTISAKNLEYAHEMVHKRK